MDKMTPSMEDYLETIMLLERNVGEVRVTDIANKTKVAKSSVHTALHSLADKGLIIHERYRTIQLTEEGRKLSEKIYAKHKCLTTFFEKFVGVPFEIAEQDACAVEHILSDQSMQRIIEITAQNQKPDEK